MKPVWLAASIMCLFLAFSFDSAGAQTKNNYHTWVGKDGQDIDTCGSINVPCRSMYYAQGKTYVGGEIQCMEAADRLSIVVTASLTISCDTTRWSNSTSTSFSASPVVVNMASGDTVVLRGLRLDGARYGSSDGIVINGAGTVVLDRVELTNWAGSGLLMQPTGTAKLIVSNSLFAFNGNFGSSTGAALRVSPQSSGSAQVNISHTDFSRNVFGVAADGSNSSAGINLTVTDSVSGGNAQDGFIAVSSSAPIGMLLTNVKSLNNGFGIRSIGNGVAVRVDGSKVAGNGTGVASGGGGALLTFGNNVVEANGTNGAFSRALGFK